MGLTISAYGSDAGESPIIDFLNEVSEKELGKCLAYIKILEEEGPRLPSQYVKHIEGDIWELRPEFGGVEIRLFYFIWVDELAVIVHALKKKRQQTKRSDIKLAVRRSMEVKNGTAHLIQIFP